jgi:hypothetical protein
LTSLKIVEGSTRLGTEDEILAICSGEGKYEIFLPVNPSPLQKVTIRAVAGMEAKIIATGVNRDDVNRGEITFDKYLNKDNADPLKEITLGDGTYPFEGVTFVYVQGSWVVVSTLNSFESNKAVDLAIEAKEEEEAAKTAEQEAQFAGIENNPIAKGTEAAAVSESRNRQVADDDSDTGTITSDDSAAKTTKTATKADAEETSKPVKKSKK